MKWTTTYDDNDDADNNSGDDGDVVDEDNNSADNIDNNNNNHNDDHLHIFRCLHCRLACEDHPHGSGQAAQRPGPSKDLCSMALAAELAAALAALPVLSVQSRQRA